MAEGTDVVGVLRRHLEEMHAALDRATGYFSAHDLAENYRTGSPTPRPTRITTQMIKARDHALGYLEADDEPVQ